ncbi:MAG TPA: ABC transporter [Clostridiales bacterium]|nr:ABC transporter [Clostridiales bacterium]
MKTVYYLTRRNCRLFFKDKGMFFSSLITPIILLVLYATFLAKVYRDSFANAVPAGLVSDSLIDATVAAQLISSLLAVICVTVAFCANLISINDKASGVIHDLTVTPVRRSALAVGYFASSAIVTLIVTFTTLAACLIYLAFIGWYMSVADVFLLLLDVLLLTLFGTAIASCVNFGLTTNGQASAVGTIVSAGYGFICGAYMPISSFGTGLQRALSFLPGTYGTCLIRNHAMSGVLREMRDAAGFPEEILTGIRDSIDCNLSFFGTEVTIPAMYLILTGATLLLVGLYILLNALRRAGK